MKHTRYEDYINKEELGSEKPQAPVGEKPTKRKRGEKPKKRGKTNKHKQKHPEVESHQQKSAKNRGQQTEPNSNQCSPRALPSA